jgi:outer membrane protein
LTRRFPFLLCLALFPFAALAHEPLSLASAVDTALSANKSLIGARLLYESEQHALASAQSEFDVRIVPSVSLGRLGGDIGYEGSNSSVGVSLNKKFIQGTQLSVGPSYNQTASGKNTTLNASLHQPLLRGLGREVGADPLHRAEYVLDAARRNVEQTQSDIALDTIVAYYEVLRQEQLLVLHRLVRDRLTRHALMARGKEKVGLANPMATYRAELRLNDAEEQVQQAGYGLENAKNRLKQLLEWPLERELNIQPPPTPALPDDALEQAAVESRADLKQLRADIEEAERNVKLAQNRVLPDLNLIVNYGQVYSTDPALIQNLSTTQQQWGVYLQASTDLYRSAEKESLRRARLRVESLRLTLETRLQDVARALRQQRLQLEEAGKRTRLRQDQIRVAEGKLALAETKFMHDLADNFDVIEAEIELQRARVSLLGSQIEHAVGTYRLWAAANRLLERAPWKPGVLN